MSVQRTDRSSGRGLESAQTRWIAPLRDVGPHRSPLWSRTTRPLLYSSDFLAIPVSKASEALGPFKGPITSLPSAELTPRPPQSRPSFRSCPPLIVLRQRDRLTPFPILSQLLPPLPCKPCIQPWELADHPALMQQPRNPCPARPSSDQPSASHQAPSSITRRPSLNQLPPRHPSGLFPRHPWRRWVRRRSGGRPRGLSAVPPQYEPTEDVPRATMAERLDQGIGWREGAEKEEEEEDRREEEDAAEEEEGLGTSSAEDGREGEAHAEREGDTRDGDGTRATWTRTREIERAGRRRSS